MARIGRHLSYANVTATLALVLAASGGAVAATGGFSSGGKLQACVNQEGAIRLLKPGKHCRRGQTTVSWNQAGPAGAKGTAGTPGAVGPTGSTGPPGRNGTNANETIVIHSKTFNISGLGGGFETKIMCDEGEHALSGGVSRADGSGGGGEFVAQSAPITREGVVVEENDVAAGWAIAYTAEHAVGNVIAEVTCAK